MNTKMQTLEADEEEINHALAALRNARTQIATKIAAIQRDELSPIDQRINNLIERRDRVQTEMQALSKKPRVSDHAVVRFLEREYGFDFEAVRESLLTDTVIAAMDAGATSVKANGVTLRLKGKCVATVTK